MSTANFFDTIAEEGSENDDSFDEEGGEVKAGPKRQTDTNGNADDSSEEEDDDDEEAEREVREGFIVEDEDEEEERRHRRKHKRSREEREDENLDADDLDLIGELEPRSATETRFKRLKRGHRDSRAVDDIFNSDDEDDVRAPGIGGEFDDFIEEDEPAEERELRDELEVSRRPGRGLSSLGALQISGLDETAAEDMRAAFGDGTEYDWALELQEAADDQDVDPEKELELKDVFEPSQLVERMLTDEDHRIRQTDIPERLQLARAPFQELDLTDEEFAARAKHEADWVADMMLRKKRLEDPNHAEPFRELVAKILHLMNVENYEVPFIVQNRKDYLIHVVKRPTQNTDMDGDGLRYEVVATKLLVQDDLWEIVELDLRYRALSEKRAAVQRTYDSLKNFMGLRDEVIDELLPLSETTEEVQDLQDYINFQYSAELKDISATNPTPDETGHKRSKSVVSVFERLRAAQAYNVVRGFGITADNFARSALEPTKRAYTEDPDDRPDDMADRFVDGDYSTGEQVLRAAKAMFAEELIMSPRMKKLIRRVYFTESHFDVEAPVRL